jgi:hypothetical protein
MGRRSGCRRLLHIAHGGGRTPLELTVLLACQYFIRN